MAAGVVGGVDRPGEHRFGSVDGQGRRRDERRQSASCGRPSSTSCGRQRVGSAGSCYHWSRSVIDQFVPAVLAWSSTPIDQLDGGHLDVLGSALTGVTSVSVTTRRQWHGRLFGLRQLLFEHGQITVPPQRGRRGATLADRLGAVPADGIRDAMEHYVTARSAVLARSSIDGLVNDLIPFGMFLGEHHPDVTRLAQLERHHIEEFLAWNRTRGWRGRKARDQPVSASVAHSTVLSVRNFLDDITLWGWADRPARRVVFATDVPRLPRPLPRALAPSVDAALIDAVGQLDDLFARSAILLLRRAGLRLGECLDLELGCVVDYGPTGTWLRVPLGKLGTERSVPLDADTVTALDNWVAQRGTQRAHPHPRTGAPADFLFAEHGRRLKSWRIRNGLHNAVDIAGLTGPDNAPLRVTPHMLRHTYATELANAGMSLQALMALLGHVTPEMTLRYATLASPTLRAAYDEAIGKVRKLIPVAPAGRPTVPAKVDWIASEFLKTRLTGGYCSRHLAAEAYANVCETCDNFVPSHEFVPALQAQLDDIRALRTDAEHRGWTSETARHGRVPLTPSTATSNDSNDDRQPATATCPRPDGRLIESTFSTVRLRTKVTKGPGSKAAGLAMAFKLIESAQARWRAVNGPQLVALVRAGARFEKGVIVEREQADQEAAV